MNGFLKFRNRALQTLILGLVVLTFYAYYRTTVNELHPMVLGQTGDRFSMKYQMEVSNVSFNSTVEATLSASSRNLSFDTSMQNINSQVSVNDQTNRATVSAPASKVPQTLLISTNEQTTNRNETMTNHHSGKIIVETLSSSVPNTINVISNRKISIRNDTAKMMYRAGHEVSALELCPKNGTNIDLVITITSAPSHGEARTAIRQTWGHFAQRRDIAILFMLGSTNDPKLEKLLEHEEVLYGDIVRGRFHDSYANLTLKTISSLEWIKNNCREAKFVLKTDDDMFINVPRLLSFLHKHEKEKNVIFGRLAKKWKPCRNKKSKYYVSMSQYKPSVFPDFTTGPAYLMPRDIIEKIYWTALDQTYLKLEDVFTTGVVAEKLGIRRSHASEFSNTRISHNSCNVQRSISIHMVKYSEQFDLWKKLLDGKVKCIQTQMSLEIKRLFGFVRQLDDLLQNSKLPQIMSQ